MLLIAFLLFLFAPAKAYEGQSGAVLPGALPIDEGGGSVGLATGQYIWGNSTDPTLAAELSYGLHEDLSFHGAIGPHMIGDTYDGLMVFTALRYTLRDRPGFHMSAWVAGFAHGQDNPTVLVAPGIALEGGWKRIRLDFTGAPMGLNHEAQPADGDPALSLVEVPAEGGISFVFWERHSIRLGGSDPSMSYRFKSKNVYAEVGHSQPEIGPQMWNAKLGARF